MGADCWDVTTHIFCKNCQKFISFQCLQLRVFQEKGERKAVQLQRGLQKCHWMNHLVLLSTIIFQFLPISGISHLTWHVQEKKQKVGYSIFCAAGQSAPEQYPNTAVKPPYAHTPICVLYTPNCVSIYCNLLNVCDMFLLGMFCDACSCCVIVFDSTISYIFLHVGASSN